MNYICSKCGSALDYGEKCECGGRAMRADKTPAWKIKPPAGRVIRYEHRVKKHKSGEIVAVYYDAHKAIMNCGAEEYIDTVAVVG